MQKLRDAVADLEVEDVDVRELSGLIDRLQAILCQALREGVKRGDHLLEGRTPCGWVAETCRVSGTSAADRLCVGAQLEKLPRIELALRAGEIGFQASAVICHLSEQLGERRQDLDQEQWIGYARQFSIKNLRQLAEHARYLVDPDGAERDSEEDYAQRYLHLSELGSMYKLDAVLDREAGMALKTALEALTKRLGPTDDRSPKQRRADAFKELVDHALDRGTLPRRHGVRPHLSVHTTPDGLKGELGDGAPITGKTVQRLACDAVMHRVLKAESMVIDVGRAKRTAQPAQWRALNARHRTCAAPGCERPIGWTQAHHVEFWSEGGETNLRKLIPLCYYHHRLVHEGGWQVVLAGQRVEFIPPDTPAMLRRRWGERRWAA
jgi:Domain of unknown function (DUF222)